MKFLNIIGCLILVLSFQLEAAQKRIILIGDSITKGSVGSDSYRYTLYQLLKKGGFSFDFVGGQTASTGGYVHKSGWDMHHEGHRGKRVDQIMGKVNGWVSRYKADIALVHLGTNDINQKQDPKATAKELGILIKNLRKGNSKIIILLAQIIKTRDKGYTDKVRILNQAIPGVVAPLQSKTSPIHIVDLFTDYNTKNFLPRQRYHPNPAGDAFMGHKWFATLSKVMKGGAVPPEPTPEPQPSPVPQPTPEPKPEPGPSANGAHGLVGIRKNATTIELSWKAPPGNPDLKEYGIVLGPNSKSWKRIKTVGGTVLKTTLNNITKGNALLQVRAVMKNGNKLDMSQQIRVSPYQPGNPPEPKPAPEPSPEPAPEPEPDPGIQTIYQAEHAELNGPKVIKNYVDYIHPSDDSIEWTIKVAQSGNYVLGFQYALSGKDRPLQISVDGSVASSSLPFPSTGGWKLYKSTSLSVFLSAGVHKVKATAIGKSGGNIDYLSVMAK